MKYYHFRSHRRKRAVFLPRDALKSAVLAMVEMSVCPSVRRSLALRQNGEYIVKLSCQRFSHILPVFGVRNWPKLQRDRLQRGRQIRLVRVKSYGCQTNSRVHLAHGASYSHYTL